MSWFNVTAEQKAEAQKNLREALSASRAVWRSFIKECKERGDLNNYESMSLSVGLETPRYAWNTTGILVNAKFTYKGRNWAGDGFSVTQDLHDLSAEKVGIAHTMQPERVDPLLLLRVFAEMYFQFKDAHVGLSHLENTRKEAAQTVRSIQSIARARLCDTEWTNQMISKIERKHLMSSVETKAVVQKKRRVL
jgi:hypothetical protein